MPFRNAGVSLLLLVATLAPASARAQADDAEPEGAHFYGYADILYSRYDFGPDSRSGENGSRPEDRTIMDLQRFVLGLGYEFDPTLTFLAEIELEHGGTGAALELEYEEFGEYEQEVEKGGEIVLEQLHLTKSFAPALGLRAGHLLVAMGGLAAAHLPIHHFGTVRPEAETSMIPVTWHETGLEIFGKVSRLAYQLQLVNALDSTGFGSKFWVRDGLQKRFEQVRATDLAAVTRVQWNGIPGVMVGASGYYGNTTGNRPKPDMEGVSAPLTIVGLDLRVGRGPFRVRASAMFGHLENAAAISRKNGRLSTNLGVSRTPVAAEARAWGAEAGVDILRFLAPSTRMALFPFARVERVNTMHRMEGEFFADPRFDRWITTAGVNWFARPTIVVKLDHSIRSFGSARYRVERTWATALGWVF